MSNPGGAQVIVAVGDSEPRIDSFRLARAEQITVTVSVPLSGSMVSLSFDAGQFLAFVEQLRQFAASMPGRRS